MPKPPARISTLNTVGTRARNDRELVASWLASLGSPQTRRVFKPRAEAFLAALPSGLRNATVEDVREALAVITADVADSTANQYVLQIKSLLSYAHRLGYTPFNAGVVIKVRPDQSRASLAKRIISEVEVGLLIREANSKRDRVLLRVLYAGGLRVSEVVGLKWADVIERGDRVQLSITGK
ncbi:MAG: tyrosine-type recombinase/integrase, partial [Hyphomicrobium sp.]